MSKRLLILLYFVCRCWPALSQNIGIGTTTPNVSAALDITNTGKGLLIPRVTSSSITAIPNPAKGLMSEALICRAAGKSSAGAATDDSGDEKKDLGTGRTK